MALSRYQLSSIKVLVLVPNLVRPMLVRCELKFMLRPSFTE